MNGIASRNTWRWLLPPIGDFFIFYLALATTLDLREPEALNLATVAGLHAAVLDLDRRDVHRGTLRAAAHP